MATWSSTSKVAPTTTGGIDVNVVKCKGTAQWFFNNFGYVQKRGGAVKLPAALGNYDYWINNNYYDEYHEGSLYHYGNIFPLFIFGDVKVGLKLSISVGRTGTKSYRIYIYTYKDSEPNQEEVVAHFRPRTEPPNIEDLFYSNAAYITIAYVYGETESDSDGLYVGRFYQQDTRDDPYVLRTVDNLKINYNDENGPLAGFTTTSSNVTPLSYGGVKIEYDSLEDSLSNSGTSSGSGHYGLQSDDINWPGFPNISALDTGFVKMFSPLLNEVKQLSGYLWSDEILDELSKLWSDPFQLIISLGIVPFVPETGQQKLVKIGALDTGVNMVEITNQYKMIDCGTLHLYELFGSALDYNPYCQVSLYIPFCGTVPLNIDEIMDMDITIRYYIDCLSGAFTCLVRSKNENIDSVLYHFSGNCLTPIPMTSESHGGLYASIMNVASGIIGGGASGGAGGAVGGGLAAAAKETLTTKTTVSRSGSLSGNVGLLDNMKPYFIVERAIQSLPNSYREFNGYPSNITYSLFELSGFTQIEKVISNTLTCPQMEQDEIINLLKEGVYL